LMKTFALACVLLACLSLLVCNARDSTPSSSKGYGPEKVKQVSGFITVEDKTVRNTANIFYWLFESRSSPSKDPLILWITGGLGCSSEVSIFYENGPYRITKDLEVSTNENSWNSNANMLFVDVPIGTGFSFADTETTSYPSNESQVAKDLVEFLHTFYDQFPKYKSLDLFIGGSSYAAHYVTALTHTIFTDTKMRNIDVPLTGFIIGNPLMNPSIQYKFLTKYALDNKLISKKTSKVIEEDLLPRCLDSLEEDESSTMSVQICKSLVSTIWRMGDHFNVYDIREQCVGDLCYDFSALDDLMRTKEVQKSLGIKDVSAMKWSACSVNNEMMHMKHVHELMGKRTNHISELLDGGIRGLVYVGKEDFMCNWYGNEAWLTELNWEGGKTFKSRELRDWTIDGTVKGQVLVSGPLTFVAIDKAGHLVSMDVPETSLTMINAFLKDESLVHNVREVTE